MIRDENVVDPDMKQRSQTKQIVNSWQCSSVLPFVDGLRRMKAKGDLQIMYREAGSFSKSDDIGAGQRQIDCGKIHIYHL